GMADPARPLLDDEGPGERRTARVHQRPTPRGRPRGTRGEPLRRRPRAAAGPRTPGHRPVRGCSSTRKGSCHVEETGRKSRARHRRQQRPRAGDGRAVRRRGCQGVRHRPPEGGGRRRRPADRPRRRRRAGRHLQAGRLGPAVRRRPAAGRPARRAVRQRRRRRVHAARADHRGPLRQVLRHQRQGHAVHRTEGAAADARRGVDRAERVDGLGPRRPRVQRLRRDQGRPPVVRPDVVGRPEAPPDPGERRLARRGRHPRLQERTRAERRADQAVRRPGGRGDAAGADRHAGRDRQGRALPGLGRQQLRERDRAVRRRRAGADL
ncbi:MAG: Uncharacterized oxidoreductase YkvO, partial [uncultured Phycisphaerae bacterium]